MARAQRGFIQRCLVLAIDCDGILIVTPIWKSRLHDNEAFAHNAAALCRSSLISAEHLTRYLGSDTSGSVDLLFSFDQLDRTQQKLIFPLFDADFYSGSIVTHEAAESPLLHYLSLGIQQALRPHALVDPAFMSLLRPDLEGEHGIIDSLLARLQFNLVDPSPFFSCLHYQRLLSANGTKVVGSLLDHFVRTGGNSGSPTPFYDDALYRASGQPLDETLSGRLIHFVMHGDAQNLRANRQFEPEAYATAYPDVATSGRAPLDHYLAIGRYEGRSPRAQRADTAAGSDTAMLFKEEPDEILARHSAIKTRIHQARRQRQEAFQEIDVRPQRPLDHKHALEGLRFPAFEGLAEIDVLIPCYNEFELTVECLLALHDASSGLKVRPILIDDASPDERMASFQGVDGLIYHRNSTNLHFLRSCNEAYRGLVSAPLVLLLNNDTQLHPDALQRLADALNHDDGLGAVGPMILYPNGRLQEAGCELLADGRTNMLGVGGDPEDPQFNWAREVTYISGACLLLRRAAVGTELFDERFAPAYCEDSDLCLRLGKHGWRTRYVPDARIVHHLSVSTGRGAERKRLHRIVINQQKLQEKWSKHLTASSAVRTIAFYLPQFHATPENDLWWGKGFTEWTNVVKSRPAYAGHYQPRLPADLGFYNLLQPEVMGAQQSLAARYGIDGFAMYYYNFGGRRVLYRPLENLLNRPDIDFRFCLCWANENWTRHWDGGSRSILLEQLYDEATLSAICADFVRIARDPRVIRVDGKPIFMLYRPLLLPDPAAFGQRLRDAFASAGHPGVYLMYVESMEAISSELTPAEIGFDACVEFPPQGVGVRYEGALSGTRPGWSGHVYDYAESVIHSATRPGANYPRHPCVFPGWDNSARQPMTGVTFVGAQPELFEVAVEEKIRSVNSLFVGEERLLFVNAWNEWAEGTYLEPDQAYGHRWLSALERGRFIATGG